MTITLRFDGELNDLVLQNLSIFAKFKVYKPENVYATNLSQSEVNGIKNNAKQYDEIINIKELDYNVASGKDI